MLSMLYTRLRRYIMFWNDVIEVWCTRSQCYLLQPMTRYADLSQLGPYLMLITRLTWISDGNLPTEKPLFALIENNNDISEQCICRNGLALFENMLSYCVFLPSRPSYMKYYILLPITYSQLSIITRCK